MNRTRPISRRQSFQHAYETLELRQMLAAHIVGSSVSYGTIQAAVDASSAGATITVDAGTYNGTVTVNKRLTLRGAGAGVDARSNARRETNSETTVMGDVVSGVTTKAFNITASDVTLDGFLVTGETDQNLIKGAGIVIAPGVSGTKIINNFVQNNVAGLFLANASSSDPAIIQHNVFRDNNNTGTNGGRGIYTDQSISGGLLTNVQIDGNSFLNNYGGSGTTRLEGAVALESTSNEQSQTNISFTNNVFDNDGKAILVFNVTGLTFTGNTVTKGRDWYSGIVRFEGNGHNVTITGNNLYANTGPAVAVDTKGVAGDNTGFVVTGNNIYGNGTTSGLKMGICINGDLYDGTFDARNNYWGAANGPSGDGPGSGDSVYGQGHVVSGHAWSVQAGQGSELFSPWATTPIVDRDTAYWGVAATAGYRIQAEDFNNGGQGNGYYDTTSGNSAGAYRQSDVDLATTADAGGGYTVTNTAAGEWLDYSINLAQGGTYRADLRLASAAAGATFRVLVDGVQVGADTAVPSTGSATAFATVSLSNLSITSGNHVVRVLFVKNNTAGVGPNFNWLQLTNTAAVSTPTAPTGLAAAAAGQSQINLSWTNTASNAANVKVLQSSDGTNYTTAAVLPASATSYSATGLATNTKYTFYVVATNSGGDSPASNIATATTSPAAVTALSSLAWTSATCGYLTPQTNASIKGNAIKLRGTTYASGIGTHADSTITYDLAGRYNQFTSSVGVDDETSGAGAVRFQVYGDGALLFDSGVLTGTSAVKSLAVSVKGVKTLKLVASRGVSDNIDYDHADWAGAALLQANTPVPAAPSGLSGAPLDATSIRLAWTPGDATQTSFKVERSLDAGASWTTIATPAAAGYTDTGLKPATTYTYRVRATNSSGDSTPSNVVAVTTPSSVLTTQLSSLNWTSATVGYGTIQKDLSIKGNALLLRGTTYASGIGTHASSTITYNLGGKYQTFASDIGVDDEVNGQGSVVFQVIADGKVLFDSGVLTGSSPVASLAVNVTGVTTLQIVALPGADGIDYDHADWAGARLIAGA